MRKDMPDPTCYLDPEERWRAFGCAIVKQAALDWKDAVEKLKKYDNYVLRQQKNSAEHFLSSKLCDIYSGIDGKVLLKNMKEMFQ